MFFLELERVRCFKLQSSCLGGGEFIIWLQHSGGGCYGRGAARPYQDLDADKGHLVPTGMMNKVGMRCARPKIAVWWSAFTLKVVRPYHLATHLSGGCYGRWS